MYTVIIPTMWKFAPFTGFLSDLVAVPTVAQIIIINNAPDNTPDAPILRHPKIQMHSFGRNIFVNPAWNFGVANSLYDKICILNDDVIFDLKIFNRLIPMITPERGAFGISPGVVDTPQTPVTTGEIEIIHSPTPYNFRTHIGFGMLMFCHRANWVPIIDGLDIYWGDNFIYDTQYYALNQNYIIQNMFHYTPYATTCSTIEGANQILLKENAVYNEKMPAIFEEIRVKNHYRTGL